MESKKWNCDGCGKRISVFKEYKPEYCCEGYECGCLGMVVNPICCDECERKLFNL